MIGTPDIDHLVETAIEFVHVVGNIRGKIGGQPVIPLDHPVLFIAEIGGAKPQGAMRLIYVALVHQRLQGFIDKLLLG